MAAPSYLARLRSFWFPTTASALWLGLGLLPLLFFQTTVHEGSHCLAMIATGVGCAVLAPFPAQLSFGSVYGVTFGAGDGEGAGLGMIVAPQVVAALLILGLHFALRRTRDERFALLTRLWLLGACLDLLNNTAWRGQGWIGDWSALAGISGLGTGPMLALSAPLWALGAWGLFAAAPSNGREQGASWRDFWEIGVIYAAVSLAAAWVSLRVAVPDSDPTALWHRVPILLQAASAVVCLAVVAAARYQDTTQRGEAG